MKCYQFQYKLWWERSRHHCSLRKREAYPCNFTRTKGGRQTSSALGSGCSVRTSDEKCPTNPCHFDCNENASNTIAAVWLLANISDSWIMQDRRMTGRIDWILWSVSRFVIYMIDTSPSVGKMCQRFCDTITKVQLAIPSQITSHTSPTIC